MLCDEGPGTQASCRAYSTRPRADAIVAAGLLLCPVRVNYHHTRISGGQAKKKREAANPALPCSSIRRGNADRPPDDPPNPNFERISSMSLAPPPVDRPRSAPSFIASSLRRSLIARGGGHVQ